MSLSVASSAATYGTSLRNDLAGLPTLAASGVDTARRQGTAPSWSWTPTSTGSGRRDTRVASLMAVLAQFRAPDPDQSSASSSPAGAAQAAAAPFDSIQQNDPVQGQVIPQSKPSDNLVDPSTSASTENQSTDDAAAVTELKLEALFKTLQAYGL